MNLSVLLGEGDLSSAHLDRDGDLFLRFEGGWVSIDAADLDKVREALGVTKAEEAPEGRLLGSGFAPGVF